MRPHGGFSSSGITRHVLGIVPMGFFPRTTSFTNLSFVDAHNPLTGHSYLFHTLHVFVGTRGQTFLQDVLLPSTHTSDWVSSSVCNLMRYRLIHLLLHALGAPRPLLLYLANRIRSDGQPRCIWCYKMCSIDSGLWYWDATTQAAHDDTPSQRRGWRGVLSFSFEDRACQCRVTLPCKSVTGVCAPYTSSSLRSVRSDYSTSIIQSIFRLKLHIVEVKTTGVYLSTDGKCFLCYSTSPGLSISGFSL